MSTRPEVLPPLVEPNIFEIPRPSVAPESAPATPLKDPRRFAEEQMRCLVRQVFCPGWPKPARQVVFAAIDQDTDVASICMQAGQALSEQIEASICIVEMNLHEAKEEEHVDFLQNAQADACPGFGSFRYNAHQVSTNLWHISSGLFMGEQNGISATWLRNRLAELRLEFDYAVLHGPPASSYSESALMGHLTDGMVLVLEANQTRRVTARRVKETLHAANVRVLGAVLNDRIFPIPQGIYDRI
jgi:hypothetical protein